MDEVKNEESRQIPANVEAIFNKLLSKTKRDIFRINGERTTAINFEHVTSMSMQGKQVSFTFYTNQINIDLEDEAAANRCFEELIKIWSTPYLINTDSSEGQDLEGLNQTI